MIIATVMLYGCSTVDRMTIDTGDGGYVYCEQRGKGQPVVLLHGHSLDRRMWNSQWKALAEHGYRAIRLDFRGYGRSSEQREDLPMTHAGDVITLLDSLHVDRVHVVGLSMGAFVAGDLLAMHPERLLSCTMVSGGIRNTPGPSTPMDSAESRRRDSEISALREQGIDQMKRRWTEQLISSGGSRRETMRRDLERMTGDWSAWQPLHKEVRLFYGREAWDSLRSRAPLHVPTLLVRGENDVKDKKSRPREMQYLDSARYVVLPDCGHMLNMEQPETFNRLLIDFLDGR